MVSDEREVYANNSGAKETVKGESICGGNEEGIESEGVPLESPLRKRGWMPLLPRTTTPSSKPNQLQPSSFLNTPSRAVIYGFRKNAKNTQSQPNKIPSSLYVTASAFCWV